MTLARLVFRLQPFSISFAPFVCLVLAGASLWLASDMRAVLEACGTPDEPKACQVTYAFQDTHMNAVYLTQTGISLAMYGIPLVLGVPILTREIEQKTAMIAWPLAGSRLKWLAWRVLPVAAVALALIGVMAFAADQLAQAYLPHNEIGFNSHGARGLSLVTRATLMLAGGVLLGAVIGRLLPALLIGIVLAVGISVALDAALPRWVEPRELAQSESILSGAFPLNTGFEYRAPDGSPMSDEVAETTMQALYEEHGESVDPALLPQEVFFGVAAPRYPEVLVRESAAILGATVMVGALAGFVVHRRRPE